MADTELGWTIQARPTTSADVGEGPWTRYSSPQSPPEATRAEAPTPWKKYQPVPEPPGAIEDALMTVPASLVRGLAAAVGFPGDLQQGGLAGIRMLEQYLRGETDQQYQERDQRGEAIVGAKPIVQVSPTTDDITKFVERGTGPLYKPKTRTGEYVNAIGEFVPSAMLGPGRMAQNAVAFGVAPAVASEFAGGLTQDSSIEPYARGAAALTAGLAGARFIRPGRAAQHVAEGLEGLTPQDMARAEEIMANAQQRGIRLTWPEAIQQATRGATNLPDLQRVVEGSGQMRRFFADRAPQIENAARWEFNNVSPPSRAPYHLGAQTGEIAENLVTRTRQAVNDASDPFYRAASPQLLPIWEMARIQALPGYQQAVDEIRRNPQLARYVNGLPDNSVGFQNEVQKLLQQHSDNAVGPFTQQRNQQISAGYGSDATTVRQTLQRNSPEFATALDIQRRGRERFLDPLLSGPIGQLAQRDQTTKQAINVLFPTNPLPNSEQAIGDAVRALANRNPAVARELVGAHLRMAFNEAAQNLQSGANQFGGANFAAVIRGNQQQASNLEAAIRALPNGDQIYPGFNHFLEVLEATGQRPRIGSQTAFNQQVQTDLKRGSASGEAVTMIAGLGVKIPQRIKDGIERWRLGNNVEQLARIFTDPEGLRLLQRLATTPTGSREAASITARLSFIAQVEKERAKAR